MEDIKNKNGCQANNFNELVYFKLRVLKERSQRLNNENTKVGKNEIYNEEARFYQDQSTLENGADKARNAFEVSV